MLTLSYGYLKPELDDTGDVWMTAMETNIQAFNDHTHNGTNSAIIPVTTQAISSGSWVATSGGTYRQLVTLPGALLFDGLSIEMRLSTGHVVYPTIEKVSSTTYYVYINDNSLSLTAVYSA